MARLETLRQQRAHLAEEERPTRAEVAEMERLRPRVRGDCIDAPRPCPWVSCRYHLGVDLKDSGSIVFHFDDPVGEGAHPTCALDMADKRELTLDFIGALLGGSTREWARQLEERALAQIKDAMQEFKGNE